MKKESNRKYYYYKKKRGRHKKTGPKPKKKKRGRSWQKKWNFKIISCVNKKQNKYIGSYSTAEEAYSAFKILNKMNEDVEFEKRTINRNGTQLDNSTEYVLLKRKDEQYDDTINKLRNEYGKLVHITSNSDIWTIYDRMPQKIEETFWVYGYSPKTDRKTYKWIYENLVEPIIIDKYSIVRIFLYNNKVIFKYDTQDIDFVMCKNVSDSIRMYNLLSNKYKRKRNVVFNGMVSRKTDRTNEIFKILKEKTGWPDYKIYRKITR